MRFPRMTTRRWMLAVAIIGVLTYGAVLVQRATDLRRLAREYRNCLELDLAEERENAIVTKRLEIAIVKSKQLITEGEAMPSKGPAFDISVPVSNLTAQDAAERQEAHIEEYINLLNDDELPMALEHSRARFAYFSAVRRYHEQLAAKYEWYSRRPWLPVPPDPPPPE